MIAGYGLLGREPCRFLVAHEQHNQRFRRMAPKENASKLAVAYADRVIAAFVGGDGFTVYLAGEHMSGLLARLRRFFLSRRCFRGLRTAAAAATIGSASGREVSRGLW